MRLQGDVDGIGGHNFGRIVEAVLDIAVVGGLVVSSYTTKRGT